MSTFVYAPGIKVYIDSYKKGLVDVSDDLISGNLTRRCDAPSDFSFSLNNARRKYDNVFMPNDRIVVMAKRLTWMQVYTGYLNKVPLVSAWPRVVNITSECSLKRLKYFFWDPGLEASRNLVRESLGVLQDNSVPDGGLKQVVINLLEQVVDWSGTGGVNTPQNSPDASRKGSKIHIGGIPAEWFQWALKIRDDVKQNLDQEAQIVAALQAQIGANSTINGLSPTGGGGGTVTAGSYGGQTLNATQAGWATAVLRAAAIRPEITQADMVATIGCCFQESRLQMYANSRIPESLTIPHDAVGSDHLSVGLFQQQAGPGFSWGTVAECMDPFHSTNKFLDELVKIPNRQGLPFTVKIQRVQRSAYPDAYAKWEAPSAAVVAAYVASPTSTATLGNDAQFNASVGTARGPGTAGSGTASSSLLAQTAVGLVTRLPAITYREGGDSGPLDPNPTVLDCSSFVQWCFANTMGGLNGIPRTAHEQYQWCVSNGGIGMSPTEGMATPGALMFTGSSAAKIGHVEISLGNGVNTVGSHHSGTYASIITAPASAWDYAALPPGLHSDGTAVDLTGSKLGAGGGETSAVSFDKNALGNPNDFLFGNSAWAITGAEADPLSASLVGIRRLINDQPILPYIGNLMGSTMRAYSSAPNGDFIGWFPDYYGIFGTAAKMVVQPIEIVDFTVDWDDAGLVTHQFVTGIIPSTQQLDVSSGTVTGETPQDPQALFTLSSGIATIDIPAVMSALYGMELTPQQVLDIYQRFGARPNYTPIQGINSGTGEFFFALYLFMKQWAYQYNANVGITFMPELWPGMLMQLPSFNFQCYVNEVTHSFSFGPGGGFTTTVNIAAPARLNDQDPRMAGMPLAGGPTAGHPGSILDTTSTTVSAGTSRKLQRLSDAP